jgi:Ser/Thr protein kinase RdoA (MazF antagonist)
MTALTEALIFAMGEYLGKLHNISIDSYQDFAKPDQPIANPLLILEQYFQESMEECKIIVSSELLKQSEQNFKRFLPDLNDFDGPNIVHRDYRPGNVLMDDKDIVGIIDFENAMASFAQDDFSRMEMLVWPTYPTLKESFLQGYKQVRRLPNLEFLPLLKMCKLLGAIGFTIARGTWNNKYSHIYNNNLKLLVQLLAEF